MLASITVRLPPPKPDSVPAPEIAPPWPMLKALARTVAWLPPSATWPAPVTLSVPSSENRAMSSAFSPTVTAPVKGPLAAALLAYAADAPAAPTAALP